MTFLDRGRQILELTGLRRKADTGLPDFGGHYDTRSHVDDDNQLIDDLEDDRW